MDEPMAQVEEAHGVALDGEPYSHVTIGPMYMSDYGDRAYLYDPNDGEPYEVAQSGSYDLSMSLVQAQDLRDKLNKILENR